MNCRCKGSLSVKAKAVDADDSTLKPPYKTHVKYLLLPLDRHIDFGLGVTANSYHQSAEILEKSFTNKSDVLDQLPLCFLYRHSIELYLKSIILTLHRTLNLPFCDGGSEKVPKIIVNHKCRDLFSIHDVDVLFRTFLEVVKSKVSLKEFADDIPNDLTTSIANIHKHDMNSSYFRYPMPKTGVPDAEKSAYIKLTKMTFSEYTAQKNRPPVKAFLMTNENDEITEAFIYDPQNLVPIFEDLKTASKLLRGACARLRAELADGF